MSLLSTLGRIWCSPVSVPVYLFCKATGWLHVKGEVANHWIAPDWASFFFKAFNISAITFGTNILYNPDINAFSIPLWLKRHELEHVRQYLVLGPLFIPAYLIASIYAGIVHFDGYRMNVFEVKARAKELR